MRMLASAVLAWGLLLLAAAGVSADRSSPTVSFKPGVFKMLDVGGASLPAAGQIIRVAFDKTHRRYSHIDQKPLDLRATAVVHCGDMKLQGLSIKTLGTEYPVGTSGLSHSHGVYSGSKTFSTDTLTTAALASSVPNPVEICNADLEAFLKSDQYGKAQKGWSRKYDNVLLAELVASCKGEKTKKGGFEQPPPIAKPSDSVRFPVWVHCSPASVHKVVGSKPDVPVKKSGFQSARVYVNPPANADYRGTCPKEIAFGGEVEYLLPSGSSLDVRYRYRTHDGAASPVLSTTVTKSGKKTISYWKHEFGGGNPTGGYAAPAGAAGSRVIDGRVRLEVLGSSGDVIGVDQASFKLTCQPTRVSGPAAVPAGGGLQSQMPAPPPQTPGVGRFGAQLMLADLVVQSWRAVPSSANALRIQVSNIGNAASQPTTLAVFYQRSGHVVKKSFEVPALGSKQSRWIAADLGSPVAHAERLTARINDAGTAKESDLSNNTFTNK